MYRFALQDRTWVFPGDAVAGNGLILRGRLEPRGFSRVAAGFSSYEGDFRLPLLLALGSPIFHSSGEGKLGVALESLQGLGGTRRVGGLLGVAGRLSGTVSLPPVPFFFLKIALAIQGFLYFHTNCEIICSSSGAHRSVRALACACAIACEAGGGARVTAGPKRPHLSVCPGPNFPLHQCLLRGTLSNSLRSPAQVEGTQSFLK